MIEINLVNVGLTLAGLVLANFGLKLGKAYKLLKKAHELVENQVNARADGKLTVAEKAKLYDNVEGVLKEAYSVIRGLFPNKSR